MTQNLKHWAAIAAAGLICAATAQAGARTIQSLDRGWLLYRMPGFRLWPSAPQLTPEQIARLACPGPGKGWQPVQIPDDYVVRGHIAKEPNPSLLAGGAVCPLGGRECEITKGPLPVAKPGTLNRAGRDAYAGHGYLPVYPVWYKRSIFVPASAKDKIVWLDFGGVYRDAIVFLNGRFIGQHASGYTGFRLDITSAVRYGRENTLAVFVDPRWFEGWWYEGGGIYRHVRLIVTDRLQVAPWGTFVDSQVTEPAGGAAGDRAPAQLEIRTTVRNDHKAGRKFTLLSEVLDPAGNVAASVSSTEEFAAGQEATVGQKIALREALLWSLERRNLYQLRTTLRIADTTVDQETTTFGIRTLRFDPERGFFLNGRRVQIQGACVHHDFPGVGIAAPDNLWRWRIEKLKAMGANAYRCAHNPVSEAFYDAADKIGVLVMDENRHLGDTYFPKAVEGTPYSDLSDVKAMVLQHRNHPSIIMWSLCNEEGQGPKPYGAKMFAAMRNAVRKIDPTRPATGGINGGYTKEGYISVEDILGMNYHNTEFGKIHKEFPGLMIFGSEDLNSKTSRGTIETSRATGLCSVYSCGASPETKGDKPWLSWGPVLENPFVAGQFVWTGFDYRGEPNPYSWPAVTSQTGMMDICGFPKPVYYYWKAAWRMEPSVYIFPDWNLPKESAGKEVVVRCYSNCDRVELLRDGKSLGSQDMPRNLFLDWRVPYSPGTLTAVGYIGVREVARHTVQSTGSPAALQLRSEIDRVAADGQSVVPVEIAVIDKTGRIVTDAEPLIRFSIAGEGTLAGVANGNPASAEDNMGPLRKAFRGRCMVLVRAGQRPGRITVIAQTAGLPAARVVISTVANGKR